MRKIIGISMIILFFVGIFVSVGIAKGALFSLTVFGLVIVLITYVYVAIRLVVGRNDD